MYKIDHTRKRDISLSIMASIVGVAVGIFLISTTYAMYPDQVFVIMLGFGLGVSARVLVVMFKPFQARLFSARATNRLASEEEIDTHVRKQGYFRWLFYMPLFLIALLPRDFVKSNDLVLFVAPPAGGVFFIGAIQSAWFAIQNKDIVVARSVPDECE